MVQEQVELKVSGIYQQTSPRVNYEICGTFSVRTMKYVVSLVFYEICGKFSFLTMKYVVSLVFELWNTYSILIIKYVIRLVF